MIDKTVLRVLEAVVNGFDYDPGHSDLDNEQPITVNMKLGDYRLAGGLLHMLKGKMNDN